MHHVLQDIVSRKQEEIAALLQRVDMAELQRQVSSADGLFYRKLSRAKRPFVIAEFKRRSPSGLHAEDASLEEQIQAYKAATVAAVSILTDSIFFGGSYDDLAAAALLLAGSGIPVLQKDFILHPIQIYMARKHGADAVLLIARLLTREDLIALKKVAEGLDMGVLVELHDEADLKKIRGVRVPVVGVNTRDLDTLKIALNNANYLSEKLPAESIRIAESGMETELQFAAATHKTQGALIGSAFMQDPKRLKCITDAGRRKYLKACGIRTTGLIRESLADLIGINFSPQSKRRIDPTVLDGFTLPPNAVAVFRGKTVAEIKAVVKRFGFRYVQLYADEVTPAFVQGFEARVILAIRLDGSDAMAIARPFASLVDLFILDGPEPGSGTPADELPLSFPYPFLLAGGMQALNAHVIQYLPNCIGIDTASGIEEYGEVSLNKINELKSVLQGVSQVQVVNKT